MSGAPSGAANCWLSLRATLRLPSQSVTEQQSDQRFCVLDRAGLDHLERLVPGYDKLLDLFACFQSRGPLGELRCQKKVHALVEDAGRNVERGQPLDRSSPIAGLLGQLA